MNRKSHFPPGSLLIFSTALFPSTAVSAYESTCDPDSSPVIEKYPIYTSRPRPDNVSDQGGFDFSYSTFVMFIRRYISTSFALFAALLWFAGGAATSARAQSPTFFDEARLERRLKKQFKLTNTDLRRLRPLIEKENVDIARSYLHYSEADYRDNFLSLWDGIRSSRVRFEAGLPGSLTVRQKKALRSARTEAETHIMYLWLDDYIGTLASVLDLDRFQLAGIQTYLENETEKRLKLIRETDQNSRRVNSEWQKLAEDREVYFRGVLDADQFRDYLLLGTPVEGLIARINCPDGCHSNSRAGSTAI